MKRVWIAAVFVAGSTISVLLMSLFLFGCCVLPFHRVVHRVFPFCGGIVKLLTPESRHEAIPAKSVSKRFPITIARSHLPGFVAAATPLAVYSSHRLRDRIAHGALRCDEDIGLHLFVSVFLI